MRAETALAVTMAAQEVKVGVPATCLSAFCLVQQQQCCTSVANGDVGGSAAIQLIVVHRLAALIRCKTAQYAAESHLYCVQCWTLCANRNADLHKSHQVLAGHEQEPAISLLKEGLLTPRIIPWPADGYSIAVPSSSHVECTCHGQE